MSAPPGESPRPRRRGAAEGLLAAIDTTSTATGWLAGWLIVPMTLAVAYEVAARYAFNAPTRWAYDVTYVLFGAQFMLAAAYTLRQDGHIRTDVVSARWSARTRAGVDAVAYLLFFFPGALLVLHAGVVEARHAWWIGERTGPVPAYLFKAIIPLTAALLALQGVAQLVRSVRILRGRAP